MKLPMLSPRMTSLALAALAGALAFLLMGVLAHLYEDHRRIDQVWQLELLRDEAFKKSQQQPQAPPPGVGGS